MKTQLSTLEPVQPFGIKHSVMKLFPHSNLGRQETPCKLGRSTPRYFKLLWMSCGRCSEMSNSSRSRWKLAEQIVIRIWSNLVQHTQHRNITSMTQRQETLNKTKPGHRLHMELKTLKVTFSSWPLHRRTILKYWENKLLLLLLKTVGNARPGESD